MKKHEKRFIIEVKGFDGKWTRSFNDGLGGFFATREEANLVLNNGAKSEGMKYHVRQK
jgi:hypothetical protein